MTRLVNLFTLILFFLHDVSPENVSGENHVAAPPNYDDDENNDVESVVPTLASDAVVNVTELGLFLGAPCEDVCDASLPNVFCDQVTRHCECEKKYPVRLGPTKGCAKPVRLGEQCFYNQACTFSDQHALCMQINHNAICQCKSGYHTVALQRPTKRVFCSEDMVLLTTDAPTLLGVATSIAILTALICFVLKLFSRARYSRPRHYANANLAPPILFSSETDMSLAAAVHHAGVVGVGVSGRPSSRASSQRSKGTITSSYSMSGVASGRRSSAAQGSRGVLVPASRAGAARAAAILLISCHLAPAASASVPAASDLQAPPPTGSSRTGSRRASLASVHSTTSSQRSYTSGVRKFEREREQKEARQAAVAAAVLQDVILLRRPASAPPITCHQSVVLSPSPRTPGSTDELLPSVLEVREDSPGLGVFGELGPCTSAELH